MRRATPRVVAYGSSDTSKFVVEGLRVAGKRTRKFFPTRRKAEAWLRKTVARIAKEGEGAIHMPEALRVEATSLADRLKPYGKTLTDAVEHYVAHLTAVERTCTVKELIAEFTKAKEADKARELYVKDLKNRLARFEIDFADKKVAEVRTQEIDDWLRGLDLAPQTRNNFRTVLRTAFRFAVSRNYAPDNPVERTAKVKVARPLPAVFTPKQMQVLLEKAPRDLIAWLAIGGFAGLRSVEIERLDWSDVDLAERLIRISPEKSKTGKRRVVTMTDNLAAWLAPLAQKAGPVSDKDTVRDSRAKTIKTAGLTGWTANGLRHSYASYHLAHQQDAPKTAFQLGHTSPKMLYAHYNGVVTPKDAAQWWQIAPPADYGNVVAFSAEVAHA